MKELIIKPYFSVGDLLFTDSRASVREKINLPYENGMYEIGLLIEYFDYFPSIDLKILYDKAESINAFEFYGGNTSIIFEELMLFELSGDEIYKLFVSLDVGLQMNDIGFTSKKYGIGIGYGEDVSDYPDSIIIFKKNYYESYEV